MANGVECAASARAMQRPGAPHRDTDEHHQLRGDKSSDVALAEPQEARWKPGVVLDTTRHPFGDSAKERQRAECDDERWEFEPRDEGGVERTAGRANEQRECHRKNQRDVCVAPEKSEHHGRQTHHRADGKVDAAADDDGREGEGEQSDLDAQPRDLERIADGGEVVARHTEDRHFGDNDEQQDPLVVGKESFAKARPIVTERQRAAPVHCRAWRAA